MSFYPDSLFNGHNGQPPTWYGNPVASSDPGPRSYSTPVITHGGPDFLPQDPAPESTECSTSSGYLPPQDPASEFTDSDTPTWDVPPLEPDHLHEVCQTTFDNFKDLYQAEINCLTWQLNATKNDLSTSEERNEQLENEVADLRNQVDISFKLFTHLQADTKSATYKEKHGIKSLADMAIQGKEARDESPNTSTKPIRTGPTPLWQDRQKAKLDQRDEIERIVHEARRQKKPELVQKAAKQELNSVLDEHQLEMHSQFENALTKFSTLLEDKLDTALFNHASKVDQTWFNFDNLDERLTNNANFMYGAVQHNVESQLADFTRLIRADVASAIQEATEKLVEDISDKISEKKEESLKAVAADEDYGNFETADGYKNFERRLELVQDDTAHILWLLENGPLRPTEKNEGPFTDGEEEDDWEEAVLLD